MSSYHGEIPYEKRVTVIVLRLLTDLKFAEITEKLDSETRTVNQLYNCVLKRTENDSQHLFLVITQNLRDEIRTERSLRVSSESETSQLLRELFYEHFELFIKIVTTYITELKIVRNTVEQVVHEHHDSINDYELVYVVQSTKFYLSTDLKDLRI